MENQPDIVLLQETLTDEEMVKNLLSTLFPGWSFMGINDRGRKGGLVIGWKT